MSQVEGLDSEKAQNWGRALIKVISVKAQNWGRAVIKQRGRTGRRPRTGAVLLSIVPLDSV